MGRSSNERRHFLRSRAKDTSRCARFLQRQKSRAARSLQESSIRSQSFVYCERFGDTRSSYRAGVDADEDSADTGARWAEDVEELWEYDHAERKRRRHSGKDEGDGDGPGAEAAYRSRKSGRVS